jgi:hypothetical protein
MAQVPPARLPPIPDAGLAKVARSHRVHTQAVRTSLDRHEGSTDHQTRDGFCNPLQVLRLYSMEQRRLVEETEALCAIGIVSKPDFHMTG